MIEGLKKLKSAQGDRTLEKINHLLYTQYNKTFEYTPKPSHSASGVGTKCLRKIYYQYYKVDKDKATDDKGAKIFETGKHFENMVMSWLIGIKEHVPYRDKSGKIPPNRDTGLPDPQFQIKSADWRINKGYIDNVAVIDGKIWLYEIKSSKDDKFAALKQPQDDHRDQTAIYFKAFSDLLVAGEYSHIEELKGITEVAGVKVIYVNKNTSELKLYVLTPSQLNYNVASIDVKIKKANDFIDKKVLPPKTPDMCFFCPFWLKCKKEWNQV